MLGQFGSICRIQMLKEQGMCIYITVKYAAYNKWQDDRNMRGEEKLGDFIFVLPGVK